MAWGATRAGALRSLIDPGKWPVRWRLAAVSTGLTLAILVLFGTVIGDLAAQRVRGDFNREVKTAVSNLASQVRIINTISNGAIKFGPTLGDFVRPNDATARILDSNGNKLEATPGASALGPPIPGYHDIGSMRVATVAVRSSQPGQVVGYIQYGRNEEHVDSTIGHLWLFIAAGVLGGTLLACLAGVTIARRAMRPIASLTATASGIAQTGDPSRRIPEPKAEDEVGELARTLNQMLRSLDAERAARETAMAKQREFVADASHELRTPLTSVLANLELLQESLHGPEHEEEREMIGSALRSSARMSRLVTDLLLLARTDTGRSGARDHLDLGELGGDAAREVVPILGDRELRIDSTGPLPIDGASDELHRMVLNLLDNAVRYTPPGSTIELRLRREGSAAVVEVADDGPGIPAELRSAVFERFVRGTGPADTAAGGGSGLGLAIVRAVAESHGGTAEAARSELGGALFRLRLPLAEAVDQTSTMTGRIIGRRRSFS